MTGRDAFKIWAPAGARWVDWVRPVPFAAITSPHSPIQADGFNTPSIVYIDRAPEDVAVVVDMPGGDAVKEGIALAGLGFRPIPLYNGTNGQEGAMAIIENRAMENALCRGALTLAKVRIPPDAPPVFLLDSNRTHRYRIDTSVFDNSWDIYDQDMPSPDYLVQNGIRRVIVRGETIQKDLARILYKFQKKGIVIFFTDGYRPPKERTLRKPPRRYK